MLYLKYNTHCALHTILLHIKLSNQEPVTCYSFNSNNNIIYCLLMIIPSYPKLLFQSSPY